MLSTDIEQSIEATYPNFQEYAKKVRGYMTCPSISDIKLWHEYLAFQREITEAMYQHDAANEITREPTSSNKAKDS
jgi:hypothetical protein